MPRFSVFFERGCRYIAQAGSKLLVSCLYFPSAEIASLTREYILELYNLVSLMSFVHIFLGVHVCVSVYMYAIDVYLGCVHPFCVKVRQYLSTESEVRLVTSQPSNPPAYVLHQTPQRWGHSSYSSTPTFFVF